jgi:transposase
MVKLLILKVILYYNAAFHHPKIIAQTFKDAGMFFKMLPPYSPDLNPIENYWHVIKARTRKHPLHFFDAKTILEEIMDSMGN